MCEKCGIQLADITARDGSDISIKAYEPVPASPSYRRLQPTYQKSQHHFPAKCFLSDVENPRLFTIHFSFYHAPQYETLGGVRLRDVDSQGTLEITQFSSC